MELLKTKMNFIFKKKIEKKDEELFIMKYQVLTKKIKGLTESFPVNAKRFKELILENKDKSYCKFYFLEEQNILNIGLSFSNNEECPILDNEDTLYVLNNEMFIETNFTNFRSLVNTFETSIGSKLKQHTKVTTALISYDFETIDTYMTSLELHFSVDQLKFNMIQFRATDLNDIDIPCSAGKEDRISFCVHALINNLENKSILSESQGYDLGNLRP